MSRPHKDLRENLIRACMASLGVDFEERVDVHLSVRHICAGVSNKLSSTSLVRTWFQHRYWRSCATFPGGCSQMMLWASFERLVDGKRHIEDKNISVEEFILFAHHVRSPVRNHGLGERPLGMPSATNGAIKKVILARAVNRVACLGASIAMNMPGLPRLLGPSQMIECISCQKG